jgi:predicted Zn-dependent protease
MAAAQPAPMRAQALKEAAAAHAQFPFSRGIAHQYAQAMLAAGHPDDAAAYLREQVQLYKEEPKLYDLLAKAYAAEGKQALQHIALTESYVLSGASGSALDQLNIARKAPDATFYDMSVIDARERELEAERREKIKDKEQEKNALIGKETFKAEFKSGNDCRLPIPQPLDRSPLSADSSRSPFSDKKSGNDGC